MTEEDQVRKMDRETLERNYLKMTARVSRLHAVASHVKPPLGTTLRRIAFGQYPDEHEERMTDLRKFLGTGV